MPGLSGADYVALVRISTKENETLAAVGQTCERVPAHLLELFEQRGKIKRAPRLRPAPKAVVDKEEGKP